MSPGKESKFFNRSFATFEFSRDSEKEEIKKSFLWKKKVFVAVLLLLMLLVILYFLKSSVQQKSRKTKRHIIMETFNGEQNEKMLTQNIEIVPETFHFYLGNKRINQHLRQRNAEKRGEEYSGGKKFPPKGEKHSGGDREKIHFEEKIEEKIKLLNGLTKGSQLSMRLKGIYVQSSNKKKHISDEKFLYSKEINNLMQNENAPNVKREQKTSKKPFRSNGAPFRLPEHIKQMNRKIPKPFLSKVTSRGHPLTIYLDFYPMEESFKRRKLAPTEKFLSKGKENRMTMKLILFPKEKVIEEHDKETAKNFTRKSLSRYNAKEEKKGFPLIERFSKHKKKKRNHPKKGSSVNLRSLKKKNMGTKLERQKWKLDLWKKSDSEIFEERK